MLSPKHSSFLCRLNGYRAQHAHNFRRLRCLGACAVLRRKPQRPTAPGKRLRPNAAALRGGQRPARGCGFFALERRRGGRQGQRWPGASKAGPGNPVSDLGHYKILFGFEILRKMPTCSANVWQSSGFPPLNMRQMLGSMITCSVLSTALGSHTHTYTCNICTCT